MKKIFTIHLCLYMAVATVITALCIFGMQTYLNMSDNTASSTEKLAVIKEKLQSNDDVIERLTNSLGENNLAKTRAFAYIIKQDPTIIEDTDRMGELCKFLDVDELHVIDEKGFITHSTVPEYLNFDMGGSEQTKEFLTILNDSTLEIAQEPQLNGTKGILFQYIGVARMDGQGLVQVGVRPEVLEEMLKGTSVDVVLGNDSFGDKGYIFAIDESTNLILAHNNTELIGKDAAEAGFPKDMKAGNGKAVVDGQKGYYVAEEYDGMLIGTMLPSGEYFEVRMSQTIVVSASMFVIFFALIMMINSLVNRKIVRGIRNIIGGLNQITAGDLNLVVKENGNPEFIMLSDSINTMVDSIKENMVENEKLMEKQRENMGKSESLIHEIKQVCRNMEQVSGATLENAKAIHGGTQAQKEELERLNEMMEQLTEQLKGSAETSNEISGSTKHSVEKMLQAKEDMALLMDTIQETSDTSMKIVKIIDEIESIASQTNMLSLNASIEAARAGEMGKGFAVVAAQVGELAARSANAAKETTSLIMNTIDVVTKGKDIAGTVVEEFLSVVGDIQHENDNIMEIAEMADEQVKAVLDAMEGLEKIAQVVENNVSISRNSEQTSTDLAEEMEKLYGMVEQ